MVGLFSYGLVRKHDKIIWRWLFYHAVGGQKTRKFVATQHQNFLSHENRTDLYQPFRAEAAYYIESNGEVAIIDLLVKQSLPYIERAERPGQSKYILETHFHADFVSGHVDLAKKTGATIVFGPSAAPSYPAHIAKDDEMLTLGSVENQSAAHTVSCTLGVINFPAYR